MLLALLLEYNTGPKLGYTLLPPRRQHTRGMSYTEYYMIVIERSVNYE